MTIDRQAFVQTLKYGDCAGCEGSHPGREEHICPFKIELFDDTDTCNCCKECTQVCSDEYFGK